MTHGSRRCAPVNDSVVWISCTVAGTTEVVLVAIIIGFLTKQYSLSRSISDVAWTASIAHLVVLLLLPITAFLYLRRSGRVVQKVVGATSALLTTLAVLLSIYTLTQFWQNGHPIYSRKVSRSAVRALCQAGFVLWAVTVIAHVVVYAALFSMAGARMGSTSPTLDSTIRHSPARSMKKTISVQLTAFGSTPAPRFNRTPDLPPPPMAPVYYSSPPSSVRYSVDNVIRPMTSKTKLLFQKALDSYSLHSDRKTSLDTIGQEDDFGDWDTSGPDDIPKEVYRGPSVRGRLETIPGSRPVSPAKALEGPFPGRNSEVYEDYLPESIIQPALESPSSETSSVRYSRRSLQSNADQAHIHPLFRSESPAPAPAVSQGTHIYASPYGGQTLPLDNDVVRPRKLSSAQGYRAESPSPLSPGRSRQNSFHSARFRPTSPAIEPFVLARPSPAFIASPDGHS